MGRFAKPASAGLFLLLLGTIIFCIPGGPPLARAGTATDAAAVSGECVVLIHGLGRSSLSMAPVADGLEAAGYRVANIDYPSTKHPIQHLSERVVPEGIRHCEAVSADKIHFVTHSMGGILLRYYLSRHSIDGLGRVVMLSPPNQGSELVDLLRDEPFYKWVNGPSGQQLGTGSESLPIQLGPVHFSLGVITGNKHTIFDAWNSNVIPGEDDGKVSAESARVQGMTDFLVLPVNHTFIMRDPDVIHQIRFFLQNGTFSRPAQLR